MLHCKRCGADWEPYVDVPKRCARCGTPYWDREIERKAVSKRMKAIRGQERRVISAPPKLLKEFEALVKEAAVAIPEYDPWGFKEDEGDVRETVYDNSDPEVNQEVKRVGRPKR